MNLSVGQRLHSARDRRGLSIADVCHETRISRTVLTSLESDDYSSFANVTYAKSFLLMYADYLDVDVSDILSQFVTTDDSESFEPHFGDSLDGKVSRLRSRRDTRQRTAPVALFLMLLALVAAIPTVYYMAREAGSQSSAEFVRPQPASALPEVGDGDSIGRKGVERIGSISEPLASSGIEGATMVPAAPLNGRNPAEGTSPGGNGNEIPSFQNLADRTDLEADPAR